MYQINQATDAEHRRILNDVSLTPDEQSEQLAQIDALGDQTVILLVLLLLESLSALPTKVCARQIVGLRGRWWPCWTRCALRVGG